ncbi:interleukin-11-like [Salvelinus fontinalis]|uniref:interleukin-11-like n=1 Tax=Salvelinus fontinalis TaxID=8038 RepID=UPI0024858AD9|nr:interleukin-11-like [Salvelinus fontinalis]
MTLLCATLKDSTAKSGFIFTLWCNISGELTAVPRVLVDSSSSLLLSLLLAQLPLFTSAVPAPYRRPNVVHELNRLANQTKNLRQITADLLKEHAFETDPEQHRFKSLPLMNNRASDINSLEMRPTLSQLHADLKSFEHHFAWLSRASRKHHHPALPKLGQMMSLIKSLTSMLEHQMMRVDAQRLSPPSPSMPPAPPSQFDVLQSSQELLLQFRLFCDWAQRVFSVLSTKSKMSGVQ